MLEYDEGDAGGGRPGHEPFEMCEPLVGEDVVQGMRVDQIALRARRCRENWIADGVGIVQRAAAYPLLGEEGIENHPPLAKTRCREILSASST